MSAEDKGLLKTILRNLLDLPGDDLGYEATRIAKALQYHGIEGWNTDFIGLSEQDLSGLTFLNNNQEEVSLGVVPIRKLISLLAFFHSTSRTKRRPPNMASVTKDMFDTYRTSLYDPTKPIIPWNVGDPSSSEVQSWKKNVKPSKSDFKEFRDENYWTKTKELFICTLDSQGLSHLIDPNYTPLDGELDKLQREWLYNVFQLKMLAPMAKTIVTNHLQDKDTRVIWREITTHYNTSMSAELRSQTISTYLTSNRLHQSNWRGTQAAYLLHWREQARQHNEISTTGRYSDAQLITFLKTAIAGTPNLSSVYQTNKAARKAAGNTAAITFAEYVELLIDQAQAHDGGNVSSSNPRGRRQVNMTELEFEDGYIDEYNTTSYEVEMHDMDTPLDQLMVMQTNMTASKGPRPVRLDLATWKSLSKKDQKAWDQVSESGKHKVLSYAANNPDRFKSGPTSNRPSAQVRPPQGTARRAINTHDMFLFDDDPPKVETQVSVHEQTTDDHQDCLAANHEQAKPSVKPTAKKTTPPPTQNLLDMATRKTSQPKGIDINHVLSQPSKTKQAKPRTASKHEIYMTRGDYEISTHEIAPARHTYEINMHNFRVDDSPKEKPAEKDSQVTTQSQVSRPITLQELAQQIDDGDETYKFARPTQFIVDDSPKDGSSIKYDPKPFLSMSTFIVNDSPNKDQVAKSSSDDTAPTLVKTEPYKYVNQKQFFDLLDDGVEQTVIGDTAPKPVKTEPTLIKEEPYKYINQQQFFDLLDDGYEQAAVPYSFQSQRQKAIDLFSSDFDIAPKGPEEEYMKKPYQDVPKPYPPMKERIVPKGDGRGHILKKDSDVTPPEEFFSERAKHILDFDDGGPPQGYVDPKTILDFDDGGPVAQEYQRLLAAGTLFEVDDTPKDQEALTSRTYTKSELGISSDTESNPDDEENYIPDEEFETDPFGEVEESRPQPLLRELTARLMPTRPTVSDITPAHSNESVATVPLDGAQVDPQPSTSTSSPPAIMVADPHIFELPSPDELAHQLEELEIEEGKTAEQDDGFVVQKSRKHKKKKKQDAPQGLLTGICNFVSPAKYTHEPSLSSGEQQGSHQGSQQSSHLSSNLSTSHQRSNPYEVLSDDQDFQEAESD